MKAQPSRSLLHGQANEEVGAADLELGRILGLAAETHLVVELAGHPAPCLARLQGAVTLERAQRAIEQSEFAVLGFEPGQQRRRMVLGFVARSSPRAPLEADIDGQRLLIQAHDEIVLECGKSSITLRRNGKVVIRGTHVETNSEGLNRIKGGQVRIN